MKISFFEIEELACHIMGMDENSDLGDISEAFIEKYNCGLEDFHGLVEKLFPMFDIGRSLLTETLYKGLSVDGVWIIKEEIK